MITVKRVLLDTEHDNQKWLILEASIEDCPQVTKRRSINTSALADGSLSLDSEKAKLIADVEEYHSRWLAVQEALKSL